VDRLIVPGAHSLDEVGPRLAGWAARRGLCVELLQADGEFSFDAMLRDLAAHADRATAHVTAKSIEYPRRCARPQRRPCRSRSPSASSHLARGLVVEVDAEDRVGSRFRGSPKAWHSNWIRKTAEA
jgi:hypothetical protein